MDDLIELAKFHPGIWLEHFGKIIDKYRQERRPVLNIFQARVVAAYLWCIANGIAPRIIGLKPRQVGGTTIFAAVAYHHGRNYNCRAITIADVMEKSKNLYRMVCDFARLDDYPWQHSYLPPTQTSFQLGNGTVFEKRSADVPTASRGDTIQVADMSECAYWKSTPVKSAEEVATSILNALADHPATFGGMESTPNGALGLFYNSWSDARWPAFDDYWQTYSQQPEGEGSGWIRVFAGWFEFPEHRESVRRGYPLTSAEVENIMGKLSEKEEAGVKRFGWDADQIAWWRWCLKAKCLGDEDRREEEYPTTPESCFLSSGRPRFSTSGVSAIVTAAKSARYESGLLADQRGAVAFQATGENEAWLRVWERPSVGLRYLISIDTMRGESETARTKDSDSHSVLVWRAAYRDSEGTIHRPRLAARIAPPCRLDNKPAALLVSQLSLWYGGCIVAVEIENGIGLLKDLRELGVPLYRMSTWDKGLQKTVSQLGWSTNQDTREMIINELAHRIREQDIQIECDHLAGELQTFIINNHGKSEAMSGKHDDDVMSAGIGVFNLESATEYLATTVDPKLPEDWDRWKTV
jgi:hypothetical protein